MDVEQVKEANRIEDVIQEMFPLRGQGRYLRAEAHDSLVVDVHNGCYYWNSQGEQGDVITWIQKRHNTDFKGAVVFLAQRAGLPAPEWHAEDAQAAAAHRARSNALTVAARHFVRTLRGDAGERARSYCYGRGWTDETIQQAGLGFADGDRKGLQGTLSMYEIDAAHPAAQAALGIRAGMLVYPHVERGRVVYLAARSIAEKAHYNPPVKLIGDRRLYYNWCYCTQADQVVVVEGQADAITLAQWEIPAIALAGVAANEGVLKTLARHKRIYLALDPDEAGLTASRKMADALGPLTRLVSWPEKDANDWLQAGATAEECAGLLAAAPMWVEVLAREAGQANNGQRPDALRRAFRTVARLDDFDLATYRKPLAEEMGLGLREFDTMLKATNSTVEERDDGEPLVTVTTVGGMVQNSDGYYLIETLYDPPKETAGAITITGGRTSFAIHEPDGAICTASHLDVDGVRYIPPPGDSMMLRKRVVSLAESVGPLLTSRELVQAVQEIVHKYVDLDPFFEYLSVYYIIFSWLYDAFTTLAYLRFRGDYGTGKSRALQVIGSLCFRPIRASGAATVSPIFRMLDIWSGTLLLEESDYADSDYAADIVKILNCGFDRVQGIVLRSGDKNSGFEPEAFMTYGPKLLAMRGEFKDKALASRCLTSEMGAATLREDIPIQLPEHFWQTEAPYLRSLLLRYRLEHWKPHIEIDNAAIDVSIEPRLNQITLALYSIVEDQDLRGDLRAFVKEYHRQLIAERAQTMAARVLEALVVQYEDERNKPDDERDLAVNTIRHLVNILIDYENADGDAKKVAANYEERYNHQAKYGVLPRKVGSILRRDLQLETGQKSNDKGRRHHVTYDPARVETLCRRYGIDDQVKVDLIRVVHSVKAEEQELAERKANQPPLNL